MTQPLYGSISAPAGLRVRRARRHNRALPPPVWVLFNARAVMPAPDQDPPRSSDAPEVASSLAWPTVVFRLARLGWHIAHGVFVVH